MKTFRSMQQPCVLSAGSFGAGHVSISSPAVVNLAGIGVVEVGDIWSFDLRTDDVLGSAVRTFGHTPFKFGAGGQVEFVTNQGTKPDNVNVGSGWHNFQVVLAETEFDGTAVDLSLKLYIDSAFVGTVTKTGSVNDAGRRRLTLGMNTSGLSVDVRNVLCVNAAVGDKRVEVQDRGTLFWGQEFLVHPEMLLASLLQTSVREFVGSDGDSNNNLGLLRDGDMDTFVEAVSVEADDVFGVNVDDVGGKRVGAMLCSVVSEFSLEDSTPLVPVVSLGDGTGKVSFSNIESEGSDVFVWNGPPAGGSWSESSLNSSEFILSAKFL